MRKKLSNTNLLNYMVEYLIMSLNELLSVGYLSEFGEGTFLAYIECLEILSKWKGFKKFGIAQVEKYFHIV